MLCPHKPGRVSINGRYTCPLCFESVPHPWYPNYSVKPNSSVVHEMCTTETGIERMAREQVDWPARMSVDVKGVAR